MAGNWTNVAKEGRHFTGGGHLCKGKKVQKGGNPAPGASMDAFGSEGKEGAGPSLTGVGDIPSLRSALRGGRRRDTALGPESGKGAGHIQWLTAPSGR